METIEHFDLAVIGSGPSGEKACMQATKLGKKVVLIEKENKLGGASLHTGSVPSKSLRETVVNLELLRKRTYGINVQLKDDISAEELMYRKEVVISEIENSFKRNLSKTHVTVIQGTPNFKTMTDLIIKKQNEEKPVHIRADFSVIATGSSPFHPSWAPFDDECIFDSDTLLNVKKLPTKISIIGAGVIGCEYACIFAKLGIRVNLIAKDHKILPFLDQEISESLMYRMRNQRITLRLGEEVKEIQKISNDKVDVHLMSGKILPCSTVLVATGRNGNSHNLGVENLGVKINNRGTIEVNEFYQTAVPNIYAVGDIIGFPSLASTGMLQARIAVLHAFGQMENEKMVNEFPLGIWTIPPIAMVGKTEEELTASSTPYEIGIAHFNEVSRAKIMGEEDGILKLIFDPKTLKILGIHIIGPRATELIHLGQSVMYFDGTIKYFMNSVFNYPTLDEAYRIAAFNGLNKLNEKL